MKLRSCEKGCLGCIWCSRSERSGPSLLRCRPRLRSPTDAASMAGARACGTARAGKQVRRQSLLDEIESPCNDAHRPGRTHRVYLHSVAVPAASLQHEVASGLTKRSRYLSESARRQDDCVPLCFSVVEHRATPSPPPIHPPNGLDCDVTTSRTPAARHLSVRCPLQDGSEFWPKGESTDRSLTGRAAGLAERSAGVPAFAGRCRSEEPSLSVARGR